jgi:hypothetical protein
MSTPPRVGTHPGTGEGCAEELASLTAALSVGRGRVGGMIDGVGRRRGRVMHTAVSEQYAEPAGGLTAIARCVPSEDLKPRSEAEESVQANNVRGRQYQ